MSRNGSGVYSLPAGQPVVTGTNISSATHNALMADISAEITRSIASDGQTVPTANLPMGGFKLTGLAAGTAAGDSMRFEDAQPINAVLSGISSGTTVIGFKNILINGDMRINQRGVTIAAAANGSYGPDRWKKVDSSNMTQIIEAGNFEPSTTYTLSGTGVTTQQLTSPASGNWTLPNIPIAATKIQLEKGSIATSFENRPIGLELALCQRYLPAMQSVGQIGSAYSVTTTSASLIIPFLVTPRVPPTGITVSAAAHFQYSNASNNYVASVIAFSSAGLSGASLTLTTSGIAGAHLPGVAAINNASGLLLFTGCEL